MHPVLTMASCCLIGLSVGCVTTPSAPLRNIVTDIKNTGSVSDETKRMLAEAYAWEGETRGAQEILDQIGNERIRDFAISNIAVNLATRGKFEKALEVATSQDTYSRISTLEEIALVKARSHDVNGVKDIILSIPNERRQGSAFQQVGYHFVDEKDFETALEISHIMKHDYILYRRN
jgi:hypothetical protein